MIDQLRVRHDLSRAPVLLLADRARPARRRHGLVVVGRRAHRAIHGGSLRFYVRRRRPRSRPAASQALARRRAAMGCRRSRVLRRLRPTGRGAARAAPDAAARSESARGAACGVWRLGQGQHAAQLLRHRTRDRSTSSSIAARSSRGASRPARICRSSRRRSLSQDDPTTCCCSPGTSRTRFWASRRRTARGGKFIIPIPEPSVV